MLSQNRTGPRSVCGPFPTVQVMRDGRFVDAAAVA
jgi:hypothetical protein